MKCEKDKTGAYAYKCEKCGQPLDYKYYKQLMRCYNCDFNRIPLACSDVIP